MPALLHHHHSHLVIAVCVHEVRRVGLHLKPAMHGFNVVVCSSSSSSGSTASYLVSMLIPAVLVPNVLYPATTAAAF
jgi:hypothetical protein